MTHPAACLQVGLAKYEPTNQNKINQIEMHTYADGRESVIQIEELLITACPQQLESQPLSDAPPIVCLCNQQHLPTTFAYLSRRR